MIEPANFAEKSTITAEFKGQVFIDQAWIRTWTRSRLTARPVSLRQTKRRAMLPSSARIGETHLSNT